MDGGPLLITDGDRFIGTLISERFEIRSLLGAGSWGSVYRAHDTQLGRDVAVKVLHKFLAGKEPSAQRFLRESELVSKLNHPHIVTIYDRGSLANKQPFIVMEYLSGCSLGKIINQEKRLSPGRAIGIISQICDALHYAHSQGVVHRDLRPDNVIVLANDHVKLVDFGLAKMAETNAVSSSGSICGTPQFMSPEQCRSGIVDARSDIYCLGLIMFNMLSGQMPFKAGTMFQMMSLHVHEQPPPLSQVCGDQPLPTALVDAVTRCLAKSPEDRFADCLEIKQAIQSSPSAKVVVVAQPATPGDRASRLAIGASVLIATIVIAIFAFGLAGNRTNLANHADSSSHAGGVHEGNAPKKESPAGRAEEQLEWGRGRRGHSSALHGHAEKSKTHQPFGEDIAGTVESTSTGKEPSTLTIAAQPSAVVDQKVAGNDSLASAKSETPLPPLSQAETADILAKGYHANELQSDAEAIRQLSVVPDAVKVLTYNRCQIGVPTIKYIAKHFPGLRALALNQMGLKDSDCSALSDCPVLSLVLQHTHITDAALAQINYKDLHVLALDGDAITDQGVQMLASHDLAGLSLRRTLVTSKCADDLASMSDLKALSLGYTQLDDSGVTKIARLESLETLDLESTPITDAAVDGIVRMLALNELSLANTDLTVAGITKLQKCLHLHRLDLSGYQVTPDLITAITHIPGLQAVKLDKPSDDITSTLKAANITVSDEQKFLLSKQLWALR